MVNTVTPVLFAKYPTPKDLAYANPAEIEQLIRPTGFFRNKTKSIMGASKKLAYGKVAGDREFDGAKIATRWWFA